MDLHTWLAYVVAACIIAVSPGSGAVLSMSHGLSYGVRKTSATILGLQLGLLLVLLIAALAPGQLWALYVGMATAMWVEYFRVCRAMARPVLVGDAVQASRLLGFGRAYVLRRHLLPALAPTLGTLLAFTTAQAVLALAALGFVGVGAQAPTAELGLMITEAMPYYEEAPWLIAAPTAVLLWLVAAMMLIQPEREAV